MIISSKQEFNKFYLDKDNPSEFIEFISQSSNGYSRELDVETQCLLMGLKVFTDATPESHAQAIAKAINDLT